MINKIFHFIWISEDFMNEQNNITPGHDIVLKSFATHNPDFEIRCWTNKDVKYLLSLSGNSTAKALLMSNKMSLVQKTDIIRMIILYKYGGIYSDLDVLCISNFDDLLDCDFFVGEEASKVRTHMNDEGNVAHDMHYINNTVIGCTKNSKIAKAFLSLVPNVNNKFRISYGPNLLETTLTLFDRQDYVILQPDFFFVKNYFTELDTTKLTKNTKIIHFYGGAGK